MNRQMLALVGAGLLLAAGCDGGKDGSASGDRVDTILSLTGDAVSGETSYSSNCASCHGAAGEGGVGPALAGTDEEGEEIVGTILEGADGMTPFDSLDDQTIADIYAFILTL